MKYKVVYITIYDDSYITHTTDADLEFEEAVNLANTMNLHLWKFHQDKKYPSIYTVREMK